MDLNTGRVYRLKEGEEVPAGSVQIPERLAQEFQGANRHERRKLLAQQRRRNRKNFNRQAALQAEADKTIAELEVDVAALQEAI